MKKTIILSTLLLLLITNQASANLPPIRSGFPPFVPYSETANAQSIPLPIELKKAPEPTLVATSTPSMADEQKEQIEQLKKIIEQLNELIIILKAMQ